MKRFIATLMAAFLMCGITHGKDGSPEQQFDALIKQLSSDHKETALQDFLAGSLMASRKPAEIKAMDAQAKGAWELYGIPASCEVLKREELGKSLVRIKWLTKSKDELPLFWNVLFYLRHGKWEALYIYFNDDPFKAGI